MNFGALLKPGIEGGRFFLVDYLPTYAAGLLLTTFVWAGAPGPLDFGRAWRTAAGLGVGEIVVATLVATLVALLFQPLQLPLVRLLEGQWPPPLRPLAQWSRRRQLAAMRRLEGVERQVEDPAAEPTEAQIQQAGQAGTQLRSRYPAADLCRPTALGNVLAAMESRAGHAYGFDAVTAWPRLYPLLGTSVKAIVDDRRNALDTAARLSVTMLVTGIATVGLLSVSGWWILLAAIPLIVSVVAYRGTVHAAEAYSDSVHVAFDLHRFELVNALHLTLPVNDEEERAVNMKLSDFWRQGTANPTTYHHSKEK